MDANEIINELGGTTAVAVSCDVSESAVSQWRIHGIPKAQWRYLALKHRKLFRGLQWQPPVYKRDEQSA